jgi:hypothetical protein
MLVQFEGVRCPDGYEARDGWIVPVSTRTKTYKPPPDAFMRFVNTQVYQRRIEGTQEQPRAMRFSTTADGMVEFANSFGLLGFAPDRESVISWRSAMLEMREAIEALRDEYWPTVRPNARQELCAKLNRHLTGAPLQYKIVDRRFHPCIEPDSLLTCLWAQLLESVSNNLTFRRCEGCGEWMEVRQLGKRFDRRTCSNACRVRANDRIKRRAIQLSRERKMTAAKIVKVLRDERWRPASPANHNARARSPVDLVRDWIKAPVLETGKVVKRKRRV